MTWRDAFNLKTVVVAVFCSILATVLTAVGVGYWQWANSGGLIHALGGMTPADVKLVEGIPSDAVKFQYGNVTASASPGACPKGSILIGAYCEITDEGVTGNLQRSGIGADHSFYCTWNGIAKPEVFKAKVRPMCLQVTEK